MSSSLGTFRESLDRLDVGHRHVTPADLRGVIEELADPPVIGTPLAIDGAELPATVETSPTPSDLTDARTGVTRGSLAIADYGSVLVDCTAAGDDPISLFPDRHIAVVRETDLVPGMVAAFDRLGPRLRESRGSHVVVTGPSATADMGALVRGAHGPSEMTVVVVDDAADGSTGGRDT